MNLPRNTSLLALAAVSLVSASTGMAAVLNLNPLTFANPAGFGSFAGASANGGTATINDVTDGNGNASRPRVISDFTPADLSQVGQSVHVSFDMVLNNPFLDSNRGSLHLALVDSVAGSEMIGLVHMGVNADRVSVGDFMKFRIDNDVSPASVGVGGTSRIGQSHAPGGSTPGTAGTTLSAAGVLHSFSMDVTRVSVSEVSFNFAWSNTGGTSIYSFSSYNPATGVIDGEANPTTSDIWGDNALTQFDSFAILLHDDDPFNADGNSATADSGSYTISNFMVTGTPVPEPAAGMLSLLALSAGLLRRRR